ncbi:MAG: universal stress protein [Myxococcota bacterium]
MAQQIPFVQSVFHPTDFSKGSEQAFAHALAIALLRQTTLTIFHAGKDAHSDWSRFPAVRGTLERWGLLEVGSPRSAVMDEFSVRVTKIQSSGNPVKACFEEMTKVEPDLLVLASEGREGLSRWLRPSVAERIARRSGTMTLLVPNEGRGFISMEDGSTHLRRILVAADVQPDARNAALRATRVAEAIGDGDTEIVLLRVGGSPPELELPESDRWTVRAESAEGDVVEVLTAASEDCDLVVATTEGEQGVLDLLRGSTTARLARSVSCPILAVPAGS